MIPQSVRRLRICLPFIAMLPQFVFSQTSITLSVDATEAPRKILHVKESIGVGSGQLALLYPLWIPGEHGPTGPLVDLAGLRIMAGGKTLAWKRDLSDMTVLRVDVPAAGEVEISFDFLLPPEAAGFSSGASSSSNLVIVSWNQVVLYPNEPKPDNITVTASLSLPEGWKYGTSLESESQNGGTVHFGPVSLAMLVDSPVLAGEHFRRIDIASPGTPPQFLDLASDGDAALEMGPDQVAAHKRLVTEALALFGAHHYKHYDFLYTLSDQVAHFGLEHHQSSDDRVEEYTLIKSDLRRIHSALLPHEFVHSWNGKYRRPAGLSTGDFSTPMKGDLLWVYEGLTQYLGNILSARSGLRSVEDYRDNLALVAARLDNEKGRTWRPVQDCANEAQLLYGARRDWGSWRRGTDFYEEGDLIWLEVDATIRQLSHGKRSLDDFCKRFHGGENSGPDLKPYTFADITAALNDVASYNWSTFLTDRLESLNPHAPLGGIIKGGWMLVYRDTMSSYQKATEDARKLTDVSYSLGVLLAEDGTIIDLVPGSPSATGGLAPGMKIIAINSRKYTKDLLHEAIKSAKSESAIIEIIAANGDVVKVYSIGYHGGERYPHLERDATKPDLLSTIIKPKISRAGKP